MKEQKPKKTKSRVTETQRKTWGGLPPTVKIGGQLWRFGFTADAGENAEWIFGETLTLSTTIMLEVAQSFSQARDTVLHEIQHAILSNVPPITEHEDEVIIRILTPWLLMVVRDNPQLVDWLMLEEEN